MALPSPNKNIESVKRIARNLESILIAKYITKLIVNSVHTYITNINKYLKNSKSDIIADFICITNNRIVITTNKLVDQNVNSDLIKSPYLLKSKSYIKIIKLLYKIE